jgi:dTDP-4-amino-4,6-dideoxygalactose transaminase
MEGFIPLHPAHINQSAITNVVECIKSGHVANGKWVSSFENKLTKLTGARFAIATSSGTAALTTALKMQGVGHGDKVVTQAFTYISTANAARHLGAEVWFVDIDRATMGMCPDSLETMLSSLSFTPPKACIPMYTLGIKSDIERIRAICGKYGVKLLVDGCQAVLTAKMFDGYLTCLSFNGNKPITTGGGGAILTNDPDEETEARMYLNQIGQQDRVWYNYRMPNINAALGCGICDSVDDIKEKKRESAKKYMEFAESHSIECPTPITPWLNAFFVDNPAYCKEYLSNNLIESRLGFPLINQLGFYAGSLATDMTIAQWVTDHIIMLPSGTEIKI